MAVHRGGLMEEEDNEEENARFEGDDLDSDTPPHLRDLAAASRVGDLEALRLALDNLNGSIDEPVEGGDTALHLVCLYGYLPCVQARDEDGAIPLHDACVGGFIEIVQLLLNKANGDECLKRMLETVDAEVDTSLHHAARGEHADVISLLLASGACTMIRNLYEKTPSELPDPDTETKRILESAEGVVPSH